MTLRVIAVAFFALAAYVTVDAVVSLLGFREPDHSPVGIVLAAVSLAVMPFASWFERRAGRELGSASAVADSKQTLLCAYLSGALLVGLLLNTLFGFTWADSLAALFIAGFAIKEGIEALRGDAYAEPVSVSPESERRDDDREGMTGIEPAPSVWKTEALPLSYIPGPRPKSRAPSESNAGIRSASRATSPGRCRARARSSALTQGRGVRRSREFGGFAVDPHGEADVRLFPDHGEEGARLDRAGLSAVDAARLEGADLHDVDVGHVSSVRRAPTSRGRHATGWFRYAALRGALLNRGVAAAVDAQRHRRGGIRTARLGEAIFRAGVRIRHSASNAGCGRGYIRGVAQLGRAPALGAGGRRFKSCRPDGNHPRNQQESSPMVTTTVEKLSPTRVKLNITVTPDELKPAIDHAYQHIAESVNIPGFRKGKVPPPIIDQRVGRAEVLNHAVSEGLDRFYREAADGGEDPSARVAPRPTSPSGRARRTSPATCSSPSRSTCAPTSPCRTTTA